MAHEVTAVVVNWNAGKHLVRCVEALLAERGRLDLEVVVVDNASSDGSLQGLDRFGKGVRQIQTGENLGFGRGVNRGVALSEGAYVAVLNPDVVLRPGALERMVGVLEGEDRAGLVGPRLFDATGRVRASCGMGPKLADEICRKFLLHLVFPFFIFRCQRPGTLKEVGWVTGACFVARRQALEAVGGWMRRFLCIMKMWTSVCGCGRPGGGCFTCPGRRGCTLGARVQDRPLNGCFWRARRVIPTL